MTAIVLFGTMIVLLIIGVPISVSLGAATMASLLCFDVPMAVVPQRMFTALDSVSIMAIPLFVLAGNLMTEGGISRRLVDFCNSIIGNIRGGMGYAMVLACFFCRSVQVRRRPRCWQSAECFILIWCVWAIQKNGVQDY